VIRFDIDGRYSEEPVERTIPWFVRVLIADVAFYFLFIFLLGPWIVLLLLLFPGREAEVAQIAEEESTPIVFLTPQATPPPPVATAPVISSAAEPALTPPERIVLPGNTRPFEAGEPPAPEPARTPEPVAPPPAPPREPESQVARNTTVPPQIAPPMPEPPGVPPAGVIGRALQNLERYAQSQAPTRNANPLGGATDPEAAIQFDRKGVNFDPWLRRFVSQVRRNWFVPLAAQSFRGRVVLQFVIHRNGRISDVHVARPSDIESFNRAAYNAIVGSNPTEPLPVDFPDEFAPFTVTFFYNERPGD
jgi:TonB family protein